MKIKTQVTILLIFLLVGLYGIIVSPWSIGALYGILFGIGANMFADFLKNTEEKK
jgi:hypothetical protein